MLIDKIKGLQLKKPIEVIITKLYTVENTDLNLYGSGATKKEAIADFVFAVVDIYEDFLMADDGDFTNGGKEFKDKFLSYFN
uniref:Uncharacterized protein n=1 Tax=viral metagenome TaxID=1070528 RepID=A0A6H2A4J7_9ZZZZ